MITIKSLQQTFFFLGIEGQLVSLKPNEQIIIDETKLNARQLKEIINLTVEDKIELLDYSLNQLKDKLEELSPLSSTSLKTINGESIVGSGDINLSTMLASKQDSLVSGTNLKTINGESLLGAGNIVASGGSVIEYNTPNSPYRRFFEDFVNATTTSTGTPFYLFNNGTGNAIVNQLTSVRTETGVIIAELAASGTSAFNLYSVYRSFTYPYMLVGEFREYTTSVVVSDYMNLPITGNNLSIVAGFSTVGTITAGAYIEYNSILQKFFGVIRQNSISTFHEFPVQPTLVANDVPFVLKVRIERILPAATGVKSIVATFTVGGQTLSVPFENNSSNTYIGVGNIYGRVNTSVSGYATTRVITDYSDYIIYRPDRPLT